jgi:hypothetical protein
MGWLQTRKARKNLEKLGMSKSDIIGMEQELKQGMNNLEAMRDKLRKKESPTYRKLIKKINDITYEPVPAKQRRNMSLALIQEATLTEWEHNDLLSQIESIYAEVLGASPYIQVLASLNQFKDAEMTKIQKVDISENLIENSDISDSEKHELRQNLKTVYKL